jgi:hypothetical protein
MSSIAQEAAKQIARAPAQTDAMAKRYFSPRRVFLCTLPLLVLVLWIVALSGLATAGGTATAGQPARMTVQVPSSAKSSSVVMLEMSIAVTRKAPAAQLGAVVRLRPPGGSAVEVGRVSIPGGSQSFQFNVSNALGQGAGGSAEVEVSVIDRGGGAPPSGAALSIGRAQIVTR